ncbi:hypothetical protein [Nocardia arizonensis]|uniref:hypothetical protein n=1 Tax=Nocardia arizonensis TaxID=1141647 RepID=UPI0006D0938F|nr:hypothetical protein [Nocardia arizonensis]
MRRRISVRALWQHLRRGLLLYGAGVGGSVYCYQESIREQSAAKEDVARDDSTQIGGEVHWDWSVPHLWYDMAHRD